MGAAGRDVAPAGGLSITMTEGQRMAGLTTRP